MIMNRLRIFFIAVATFLFLGGRPTLAQHGHGAGAGGHGSISSHGSSASRKTMDAKLTNTKLGSRLETLLNSGNTGAKITAQQACSGFKNLGQCVAAVHVSHNLGIPFADLKAKMLGTSTTGSSPSKPESLGAAIRQLKPGADATAASNKAKKQAADDMKQSEA